MPDLISGVRNLLPEATDYIIYGAIALVTLIGVLKCLVPLYTTTHALRRAIRRLQDEAGETTDRPVWQEPRFMGKRLRGCWLRFLQNAEQLDRRGLPCAVEDYINDDTVTHGPGNATLAELVPSLLTSLGILGTFMGMTQGLSGLDVTTTEQMMSGISNLLSGMQFAFGTSVAGVSCALVFNMLNRIAQGSSYRAIDDFVEAFTSLAMQRPLDNDVQLICQNQDRNHLLGTVTDTLSGKMAASIEGAINRAMQPVAQSMDSFLLGATRQQVEGVQRVVNQFVDRMNTSLNGQFLVLGKTMTEINQNQQLSMDRLGQSMEAVNAIIGDVSRLHGVSQEVLRQFEGYVKEFSSARQRDEHFEQNAASLLGAMHQSAEAQAALLAHLQQSEQGLSQAIGQFTQLSGQTLRAMQQTEEAGSQHLEQVSRRMKEAGETLSGSYGSFVEHVAALNKALSGFDGNMQALARTLDSRMDSLRADGTDGVTAAQLASLQKTLSGIEQSLSALPDALPASGKE